MGLKPKEVQALTLKEFNHMLVGMMRRKEHDWDVARNTWAHIINYPHGVKNFVPANRLRKLPFIDSEGKNKTKKISTHMEAMQFLEGFMN